MPTLQEPDASPESPQLVAQAVDRDPGRGDPGQLVGLSVERNVFGDSEPRRPRSAQVSLWCRTIGIGDGAQVSSSIPSARRQSSSTIFQRGSSGISARRSDSRRSPRTSSSAGASIRRWSAASPSRTPPRYGAAMIGGRLLVSPAQKVHGFPVLRDEDLDLEVPAG